MTPRASRLVKVTGVALGLLAGLAGGIYGYRAHAARARRVEAGQGVEAQAAAARAAEAQPAASQPQEAAAGRPTVSPDGGPAHTGPTAAPGEAVPGTAAAVGEAADVPGTVPGTVPGRGAEVPGTAAEREARLMARLAGSSPAPGAPSAGALDARPPGRQAPPAARSAPPPGSPAAREAELLRRVAEGGLPAATRPLVVRPPLASIAPEARARADLLASGRQAAEARQARETAWPAIEEAEPPPGPRPHEAPAEKPRPRAPRLELPSRLDQWGE